MLLMSPNEFIKSFKKGFNESAIEACFSKGNCWFFTTILRDRFHYLNPEIYYHPIDNHFVTKILDKLYDINGEIEDDIDKYVPWEDYKLLDELETNRIMEYCILKIKD